MLLEKGVWMNLPVDGEGVGTDRRGQGAAGRAAVPRTAGPAEGRLADYLVSRFHPPRPVRYERRIRRNRAVVIVVFILLVLSWAWARFLL